MKNVEQLIDKYYPSDAPSARRRDGTSLFYDLVLNSLPRPRECTVLNLGAGPSVEEPRRVRGAFARVVGIDVDDAVMGNADLDEAHVYDDGDFPFENDRFDLVFSDWVIEHLPDPEAVYAEVFRVLKPGGCFLLRTPNTKHYVTFGSRLVPDRLHFVANRMRRVDPDHGTHDTYYRSNSPARVRVLLGRAGFRNVEVVCLESLPVYLRFNRFAFLAGVLYERAVNSSETLKSFRRTLIAKAWKP